MHEWEQRQIAFLCGQELPVNLVEYYGRISVFLGHGAFTLLRSSEEEPVICMAEQLAGYDRNISLDIIDLGPGDRVHIGRRNGIEVFDQDGKRDEERAQRILSDGLLESLLSDMQLSREHLEIRILSDRELVLNDQSSNGTVVKADTEVVPIKTQGRRGHLRLVQ